MAGRPAIGPQLSNWLAAAVPGMMGLSGKREGEWIGGRELLNSGMASGVKGKVDGKKEEWQETSYALLLLRVAVTECREGILERSLNGSEERMDG